MAQSNVLLGETNPYGSLQASSPFEPEELELVWWEEGGVVALLRRGELLAVLPCWAGVNDFRGYSAGAVGQQMPAWEMAPPTRSAAALECGRVPSGRSPL